MQKIEVQNEDILNIEDIEEDEQIKRHLSEYYQDASADSVLIYGNKTIYALFRYLHFLYSRMNFAFSLCATSNPLYNKVDSEQEMQTKYKDFLSHLSKLINGQIEEEMYEDECRKLLGLKAFQLFTIHKVIRNLYSIICDFDTDTRLHAFYKLFLCIKSKKMSKENRAKYFVAASQISTQSGKESKRNEDLYQIEYFDQQILCISLCDKYQTAAPEAMPIPSMLSNIVNPNPIQLPPPPPSNLSISPALSSSVELNKISTAATESSINEDIPMNPKQEQQWTWFFCVLLFIIIWHGFFLCFFVCIVLNPEKKKKQKKYLFDLLSFYYLI